LYGVPSVPLDSTPLLRCPALLPFLEGCYRTPRRQTNQCLSSEMILLAKRLPTTFSFWLPPGSGTLSHSHELWRDFSQAWPLPVLCTAPRPSSVYAAVLYFAPTKTPFPFLACAVLGSPVFVVHPRRTRMIIPSMGSGFFSLKHPPRVPIDSLRIRRTIFWCSGRGLTCRHQPTSSMSLFPPPSRSFLV